MKIILPYTPEKNIDQGIRVETGESSVSYLTIVNGQTEYELPNQNILAVYAYVPIEAEDEEDE